MDARLLSLALLSAPLAAAPAAQTVPDGVSLDPRPTPSGIRLGWDYRSAQYEDLGTSVSSAGDVNGDGYDDYVVGAQASSAAGSFTGRAMVFHGSPNGPAATPDWDVSGTQVSAYFGHRVAGAGDVNGDGYDDVIVSSFYYDGPNGTDAGRVWLFLGSPGGLATTAAWFADGEQPVALFGSDVSTAGDVNADGYDDILIGSFAFDVDPMTSAQEGRAYVYLGSPTGPGAAPDWTVTGRNFMVSWGFGSVGNRVGDAGDVNGDGYDDVIVAADYSVAVFLGTATGLESDPSWTSSELLQIGADVAGVGDVNGDGYDDVMTSTINYSSPETREGAAVLYLGGPGGLETSYSWLAEGNGTMAFYGYSLDSAGDVNADGYADVIVGALFFSNGETFEGLAHVFFGSPQGLPAEPAWAFETNVANTRFGISVATAGDVDGDGHSDLIVGANTYPNPSGSSGRATLFYGGAGGNLLRRRSARQ